MTRGTEPDVQVYDYVYDYDYDPGCGRVTPACSSPEARPEA
jgi:hypothetical protein